MLKYILIAGAFLVLAGVIMAISQALNPSVSENQSIQDTLNDSIWYEQEDIVNDSGRVNPACFYDIECGIDNKTGYHCWNNFVVLNITRHICEKPGTEEAYCNETVSSETLMWCSDEELCVPGLTICQPGNTCTDHIKNQNETYIDCGGPCKPCTSCNDGVKNGDETEIDCGGSCPDCIIECTSNESCGMPRWGKRFCAKDEDDLTGVYQDWIDFSCRNPGKYTSFCTRTNQTWRKIDHCSPLYPCYKGYCLDDENITRILGMTQDEIDDVRF